MLANELRIGNWVYSGIGSDEAIEVYPMLITQLSRIQHEQHNIKPIPLIKSTLDQNIRLNLIPINIL